METSEGASLRMLDRNGLSLSKYDAVEFVFRRYEPRIVLVSRSSIES